jgi:hypothetical protein
VRHPRQPAQIEDPTDDDLRVAESIRPPLVEALGRKRPAVKGPGLLRPPKKLFHSEVIL